MKEFLSPNRRKIKYSFLLLIASTFIPLIWYFLPYLSLFSESLFALLYNILSPPLNLENIMFTLPYNFFSWFLIVNGVISYVFACYLAERSFSLMKVLIFLLMTVLIIPGSAYYGVEIYNGIIGKTCSSDLDCNYYIFQGSFNEKAIDISYPSHRFVLIGSPLRLKAKCINDRCKSTSGLEINNLSCSASSDRVKFNISREILGIAPAPVNASVAKVEVKRGDKLIKTKETDAFEGIDINDPGEFDTIALSFEEVNLRKGGNYKFVVRMPESIVRVYIRGSCIAK